MIKVAAAIICKNDTYLSARRREGLHLEGYWEFPGGKIEKNETAEACLVREINEEFGVEIEVGRKLGDCVHVYDTKTIHLTAYFASRVSGVYTLCDHDMIEWLHVDSLWSVEWAPADIRLVEQLENYIKQG